MFILLLIKKGPFNHHRIYSNPHNSTKVTKLVHRSFVTYVAWNYVIPYTHDFTADVLAKLVSLKKAVFNMKYFPHEKLCFILH